LVATVSDVVGLESRNWQGLVWLFVVEVGLFGGSVGEGLVRSDGVVDDPETVNFHVEGIAVADVAAEQMLVFERAEESFDDAVGLRRSDAGADVT
jgi:hypothetical protein